MKVYFGIPLGIILALSAVRAADFDARLDALKKRDTQITARLRRLGVPTEDTHAFPDSSGETKKAPSLLVIHSETTRLAASSGKFLFGHLVNNLVVGGEAVPVVVELDSDQGVFSDLRFDGVATSGSTEGRIKVDLNRIVLRTGRTHKVVAVGLDEKGAAGIQADVISGKAVAVVGSMGASFISGLAAASQTTALNGLGFQTVPTGRNVLLQGIAQTAADQSKRLIEESTRERPVLTVEHGTPITVYVQEEIRL